MATSPQRGAGWRPSGHLGDARRRRRGLPGARGRRQAQDGLERVPRRVLGADEVELLRARDAALGALPPRRARPRDGCAPAGGLSRPAGRRGSAAGATAPDIGRFAVVALSASVWLLLEVGAFASTAFGQQIQERNLFYLEPLFLIALVAWGVRGLPGCRGATAAAGVVAAALVGFPPYDVVREQQRSTRTPLGCFRSRAPRSTAGSLRRTSARLSSWPRSRLGSCSSCCRLALRCSPRLSCSCTSLRSTRRSRV